MSNVFKSAHQFAALLSEVQRHQYNENLDSRRENFYHDPINGIIYAYVAKCKTLPSSDRTRIFDGSIHNDNLEQYGSCPVHGDDGANFLYHKESDYLQDCISPDGGDFIFTNAVLIPSIRDMTEEWIFQQSLVHDESTIFMLCLLANMRSMRMDSFLGTRAGILEYIKEYKLDNYFLSVYNENIHYFADFYDRMQRDHKES